MLKKYTITQNGLSNGNEIHSPFEIMVTQMIYNSNTSKLVLAVCTCNNEGVPCDNDDIASVAYLNQAKKRYAEIEITMTDESITVKATLRLLIFSLQINNNLRKNVLNNIQKNVTNFVMVY